MNNKTVFSKVALFVVVVVGIIGGVKFFDKDTNQNQQVLDGSSGAMLVGNNAINVNEQKVGISAIASLVVLENKGYVVVHEMEGGKPGKIIGSSALLPKDQSSNVAISVLPALQEGSNYVAMLHIDNGDGVFDGVSDAPAKNGADVVMMEFQASSVADGRDVISI